MILSLAIEELSFHNTSWSEYRGLVITVPYAVSTVVVSCLATPDITALRRANWSKITSRMTSLGHDSRGLFCFRGLVGSGGCSAHLTLRNQMKIRESVGYVVILSCHVNLYPQLYKLPFPVLVVFLLQRSRMCTMVFVADIAATSAIKTIS